MNELFEIENLSLNPLADLETGAAGSCCNSNNSCSNGSDDQVPTVDNN